MNPKKYILFMTILWLTALCFSLTWNLNQSRKSSRNEHLQTAKSFFQLILVTRAWNAKHGGVYLNVTGDLQPNPYLLVPDRDITTTKGMELTKVNPAFMTRLIANIAEEKGHIQFHITSLQPINPGNKPLAWEKAALLKFEKGKLKEFSDYMKNINHRQFQYIAPLITEKSCLQCHKEQGYKEGDIRGGISVMFPVLPHSYSAIINSHLFLMLGGVALIIGFGNQIVKLTEQLKRQSHIDGLTQIANRKYFDICLHREWLRCRRLHAPISLIMCDIDHFKLYNDTYGHQAGDECLKRIADALNQMTKRPTDMVARYGGEEFIAILPETPADGGRAIAELMQAAIEKLQIHHPTSKSGNYVTLSFGVVTMDEQLLQETELIQKADKALYASKAKGRNIVTHVDEL